MIPKNIENYYKLHSKFYNATRWAFLFGRNSVPKYFPELPEKARILDLGCGTGKHLDQLKTKYPKADITGIDQSEDMLRLVNRSIFDSVEIKNELYSANSFSESEFHLILCSYSLSMMEDSEITLKAILKHLKPEGILLVVDFDSTPYLWFKKWMKKNHVSFEPNLVVLLNKEFQKANIKTKNAYFGLYSYSVLFIKK